MYLSFSDDRLRGINGLRGGDDKCICRLGSFPRVAAMFGWLDSVITTSDKVAGQTLPPPDCLLNCPVGAHFPS
ncbi:hypothetical protein SBA4_3670003 [Candidatus Sulfopaludibacter sp. SbA4]|nr:hypothetical protein SBA4_3670003 [Candidatus Sulfopaludibacter sp. SbA4]